MGCVELESLTGAQSGSSLIFGSIGHRWNRAGRSGIGLRRLLFQTQPALIPSTVPEAEDFDGPVVFVDFVKNKVGFVGDFPDIRAFRQAPMPMRKAFQGFGREEKFIAKISGF